MTDQPSRLVQDLMERTDGWPGGPANESALDYNFMTRHFTMSVIFLCWTCTGVAIGSIGNIFIIGAVLTYRRLSRNTTNYFILNLALADFGVTAIISPVHITNVVNGPRIYVGREGVCYFLASVCQFSCVGSMLSISAIAINRCICICKPHSYQSLFTKKKTIMYCSLVWIITSLIDAPNWIGWSGYTFSLKEMLCVVDVKINHNYLVVRSVAALGMPLVIVLTCYLSIYRYVRKAHAALHHNYRDDMKNKPSATNILPVKKEDMQLAVTLFATFVIFMILWTPYMVLVAVDSEGTAAKELYVIFLMMGHTNSLFNAFTYGVCNSNFRRGYKVFLYRLFCRQRNNNSDGARKDFSSVATLSTL